MEGFACTNCGDCCGLVPVSQKELQIIRKRVKAMPTKEIQRLQNQMRPPLTCMFRDMQKKQCGIYSARPQICQMFGFYEGLVCDKKKNAHYAKNGRLEGVTRISQASRKELPSGVLSLTITWKNLFQYKRTPC